MAELTEAEIKTIIDVKRELRFIWQQGFRAEFDGIEHDALFELLQKTEALCLRLTAKEPQLTRSYTTRIAVSSFGQTAESVHAAERESVCPSCGGRAINGRCRCEGE